MRVEHACRICGGLWDCRVHYSIYIHTYIPQLGCVLVPVTCFIPVDYLLEFGTIDGVQFNFYWSGRAGVVGGDGGRPVWERLCWGCWSQEKDVPQLMRYLS